MLALKITDLKDFTSKLFIGDVFDHFWLNSADIATYNLFSIDGKLQQDFFDIKTFLRPLFAFINHN